MESCVYARWSRRVSSRVRDKKKTEPRTDSSALSIPDLYTRLSICTRARSLPILSLAFNSLASVRFEVGKVEKKKKKR